VINTYCVVLCFCFVLFSFVLRTLCCQFFWIVPLFWLPLRFPLTFIYIEHTYPTFCSSANSKFMHVSVLSLEIQLSRGVWIWLTGLTPPHFVGCDKPGHGFPTPHALDIFMFNDLIWAFLFVLILVELLTITV